MEILSNLRGNTLVRIAVEQQCGYLDKRQDVTQIGFGKCVYYCSNPSGMKR